MGPYFEQYYLDIRNLDSFENFYGCDEVVPVDYEDGMEVTLMKLFKEVAVEVIGYPGLAVIQKLDSRSFGDFSFGIIFDVVAFPNML